MNTILNGLHFRMLAGLLALVSYSNSCAGGPEAPLSLGNIYGAVFGGGGGVSGVKITQGGTAFYIEGEGGPLAVDATGTSKNNSAWLVGTHVGYEWPTELLSHTGSAWRFTPAAELEGFYLGRNTLTASKVTNDTVRLSAHEFTLSYPMDIGVFLVNAVLNVNYFRFHPYIGIGGGIAVASISDAVSTQTRPLEVGVNHYNSDTSDSDSAFAVEPKAGIRFDITKNLSLFAEYRFLYIASTEYNFGSTVYPAHPATSRWMIKMNGQCYNLGTAGLQYIFN